MRHPRTITLTQEDEVCLERWSRTGAIMGRALRARIVLLAARGLNNQSIAEELTADVKTVARWRNRYADDGIAAIEREAIREGRPRLPQEKVRRVLELSAGPPPAGRSRWTARALAQITGISEGSVRKIWRGVKKRERAAQPR